MTPSDVTPPELPDDPILTNALCQIGGVTREYVPARGTIYAWIALLAIGAMVGFALLAFLLANEVSMQTAGVPLEPSRKSPPNLVKRIFGCLVSAKVTIVCGLLIRLRLQQLSNRVLAGPGGFVVYRGRRKEPEVYTWQSIVSIHQDPIDPVKYATVGGPPMKRDTSFSVVHWNGNTFDFWIDSLRDHKAFAKWLHTEAVSRDIPWVFGLPEA
jgi:hypothetical protein